MVRSYEVAAAEALVDAAVRAEVNSARADAATAWEDLQRAAGPDAN